MKGAVADPAEIERDIVATRGRLAVSAGALGDKVAPKKVVARTKARATDKLEDVRDRVSPVRIAKRSWSSVRERASDARPVGPARRPAALETARDKVGEVAGELTDGGRRALEAAKEKTTELTDDGRRMLEETSSMAHDVKSAMKDRAGGMVDAARNGGGRITDAVGGAGPAVVGLLAFGGAAAVAAIVGPSDKERRAARKVKEAAEPIKEKALATGRNVADGVGAKAKQKVMGLAKEQAAEAIDKVGRTAKTASSRAPSRTKPTSRSRSSSASRAAAGSRARPTPTPRGTSQAGSRVRSSTKPKAASARPSTRSKAATT